MCSVVASWIDDGNQLPALFEEFVRVEFISVGGSRTRCLMAGNTKAPSLLLLHGYGASADSFVRNIDVLGEDYFVIAPDMAGFGFSEGRALAGRCLPAILTDHIEDLLSYLGVEPGAICGHSFGGSIAASVSLRRQTKNLIIVCSGSALNPDEPLVASLRTLRARMPGVGETLDFKTFSARTSRICFDAGTLPAEMVYSRWISASLPGASEYVLAGLDSLLDLDAWREYRVLHQLEDITARVLIICGEHDSSVPEENAHAANARIADSRLLVFERCGHSPPFEQPERFNATLRAFLSDANVS